MQTAITNFLEDKYSDGAYYTHVSLYNPKGSFTLGSKQIVEEFLKLYCDNLNQFKTLNVGVAERPLLYLPVLADIDIKIDTTDSIIMMNNNHIYTEENLLEIIGIYQSVLRQIIEDCEETHLLCVVLEKPVYTIESNGRQYTKNGFHLHFPACFLNKNDQEQHLIPRIKRRVYEAKVFENLNIEDSSSVIDDKVCSVNWLMYGASKGPNMDPYTATRVIDYRGNNIDFETAFKDYLLYDNREQFIDIRNKVRYYLPRILSILPYGRETLELKEGLEVLGKKSTFGKPLRIEKKREFKPLSSSSEDDIVTARSLLPLISDFRAEDRLEWLNIGWVLYCIGNASTEAFNLWNEFSSRCGEKYSEEACIQEWDRMVDKGKTIRSLHYLAKIDSPEEYSKLMCTTSNTLLDKAMSGSHYDMARLLQSMYGSEFVCANNTNNIWYQFSSHKWKEIDGGVYLRKKLSRDIVDKFDQMRKDYWAEHEDVSDKLESKRRTDFIDALCKLIQNLKSRPYKMNVMKEAGDEFFDEEFKDKLNMNPFLFAFKNGVYDLKLHLFRDGRPDDYLSRSAPICYRNYTRDSAEVKQVELFFMKVFPDEDLREYFLDQMCQIFMGGNQQKKVYFWLGAGGDNSKSVTQNLFERMLGAYAIKFKTTLLSGKKSESGAASPELARAGDGVRLAVFQELSKKEELNIGTLKEMSGNDSYWARDLFEKGKGSKEIVPMFKMIFIQNELPKLDFQDKATWNRVRVIEFESTFVLPGSPDHEPPPDTFEEQLKAKRFPADPFFDQKINDMLEPLAWLLLERFKTLVPKVEPRKVSQATEIFRRNNDIYRQFIEESVEEDSSAFLSLDDAYGAFRDWYKNSYPNQKTPEKNDIRNYLVKLWGELEKGLKWQGYRLRRFDEDDLIIDGETGEVIEHSSLLVPSEPMVEDDEDEIWLEC